MKDLSDARDKVWLSKKDGAIHYCESALVGLGLDVPRLLTCVADNVHDVESGADDDFERIYWTGVELDYAKEPRP